MHWYLDYCCRDDYGTRYDQTSAWAGLHYCCSRGAVFTAYTALCDRTPREARQWLDTALPQDLLDSASADLREAYGAGFARCVERVDITLPPHAMASPRAGLLSNAGTRSLRDIDGPLLFAHADLSGFSVFEEAAKAPVMRITGPDTPTPSSYALEQAFMPQTETIIAASCKLLGNEPLLINFSEPIVA